MKNEKKTKSVLIDSAMEPGKLFNLIGEAILTYWGKERKIKRKGEKNYDTLH